MQTILRFERITDANAQGRWYRFLERTHKNRAWKNSDTPRIYVHKNLTINPAMLKTLKARQDEESIDKTSV